jgi:3-deoxy-D-arabino-heptulosonate 7-phosphate (DAHP) synthase
VHPDPTVALSDADQAMPPALFSDMMAQLRTLASAAGRTF